MFASSVLLFVGAGCNNSAVAPVPVPTTEIKNTTNTATTTTNVPQNTVTCAPTEHVCPCATGNYCLRMGAMCLSPESACPEKTPVPLKPVSNTKKPAAPVHATATVTMTGMQFSPLVLAIKAGDTVIWLNKDTAPHTTKSDGALLWTRARSEPVNHINAFSTIQEAINIAVRFIQTCMELSSFTKQIIKPRLKSGFYYFTMLRYM